jgi:hypothetical protein
MIRLSLKRLMVLSILKSWLIQLVIIQGQKRREKEWVEDPGPRLEKLVEKDIKAKVREAIKRRLDLRVDRLL